MSVFKFKKSVITDEQSKVWVHLKTGHLCCVTSGIVTRRDLKGVFGARINFSERLSELDKFADIEDAPSDWECLGEL